VPKFPEIVVSTRTSPGEPLITPPPNWDPLSSLSARFPVIVVPVSLSGPGER